MSNRTTVMLVLSIGCGLLAMFGARSMLTQRGTGPKSVEVLVATRDLKLEEVLTADLVKVEQVPAGTVPAGAHTAYKDVADRWVRIPILAGEAIVEGKLAPKDAPTGLVPRIPVGMRGVAVEVNEQSGVSGFVMPEHHVDVVLSRTRSENRNARSETILQNVLVLASGHSTTLPEDKSMQVRTVTLAVTPEQAEILAAARTEGTLSLSLRGFRDETIVEQPATRKPPAEEDPLPRPVPTPSAVVAAAAAVPTAVVDPRPQGQVVTIFRGLKRVERFRAGWDHAATTALTAREDPDELEDAPSQPGVAATAPRSPSTAPGPMAPAAGSASPTPPNLTNTPGGLVSTRSL